MTELLCRACDSDIFENEIKLNKFLTSLQKEKDKTIYKNYVINNVNLEDIDKKLNDYVKIHNKKFNLYFIKCNFNIKFDNYTSNIETNFVYNKEIYKINIELLYYIDCMKFKGYNLCNINQITINTYNDRCNMSYEYYTHKSLNPLEIKLNSIFAKDPKLLENNNINHLLIKKFSHISYNI